LLLVVDGLDEDLSQEGARRQSSIASLLPTDRHPGLRVLVAARTGYALPLDVQDNHPLRQSAKLVITPSPWADVRRAAAEQELQQLVTNDDRRKLLEFLAASGGGLSREDLAALTGLAPFSISQALGGIASRTITLTSTDNQASGAYEFAHKQLLSAAESAFGAVQLEQQRLSIEEWANEYQRSGWPVETPYYLLAGYGLQLREAHRTSQMISLATDSRRHERMLDLVDGHAFSLREIDIAGQLLISQTPDDLRSALRLAIERHEIAKGHQVPFSVMTTWAVVGYPRHAEALARSAGNPRDVMRALVALAVALTRSGNSELAERILGTATHAEWADAALAMMASRAARSGDVPRAAQLTARVTGRQQADRAFAALIGAAAAAGDFEWAENLLRKEVAGQQMRAKAVAAIVVARARTGDFEIAFGRAKEELDPIVRNAALQALARVASSRADFEMFENVLGEISDAAVVEWCRGDSADSVYSYGGRDAVEALIASLHDLRAKETASVFLAISLAHDNQLSDAEEIISHIQLTPTEAAISLATAVADMGSLESAERLAKQIRKPEGKAHCLGAIARSAAQLGRFDRAEYFAREIDKPEGSAVALTAISRVSHRAGDRQRSVALAAAAEDLYRNHSKQTRTSYALRVMAMVLADIDDVHRSWNLLTAITEEVDRSIAAESVAAALVRGGLTVEAESLLRSLPAGSRARATCAAVAIEYAKTGNSARE
jgi:hypothetical protein